ncbi:hypothetical protein [Streptomyces soliscabiei]|uniref:hypothetical protein n=1 Tax=Streptomyces soliscabiei TaxID=588897 RepID=UPI0029A6FE2A|nr:hypothetical protein [Streptomyces sp. NY05-11A]MDX2678288.1 hypothetical protein [Streptomyces sp. NY05-11A]
MKKSRRTQVRLGMPLLAVLALVAAGCGTDRAGDDAGAEASARATARTPSAPVDFPCPGESPSPTPSSAEPSAPAPASGDHYAENHGFMVPIPLHGQQRCDGLAAARRIEAALEPLRERGDFAPDSTRGALTRLGYSAGSVQAYQNGPTGVSFLIDGRPMCLEGAMNRAATEADAFGGYPDHTGCDRPSGGH